MPYFEFSYSMYHSTGIFLNLAHTIVTATILIHNCLQIFKSLMLHSAAAIPHYKYRQISNIRRTLVGNKIVDHSDIVGASPVGAAPTTSSFLT